MLGGEEVCKQEKILLECDVCGKGIMSGGNFYVDFSAIYHDVEENKIILPHLIVECYFCHIGK